MDEMNNLDKLDGDGESVQPNDGSPSDPDARVPTKDRLRWPVVLALRELGGSAASADIEARVTERLGLTEEQVSLKIPSGTSSKLANRLRWAAFELKQHKLLTYPSRGHRELTPRGNTITEAELDELLETTVSTDSDTSAEQLLESMIPQFFEETGYPTEADEEQERLREEWREKLLPENVERLSSQNLCALLARSQWGNSSYIARPDIGPTEKIAAILERSHTDLLRSIQHVCWGDDDLAKRIDDVDDHSTTLGDQGAAGLAKIPTSFLSKILAICYPDQFLPIAGQERPKLSRTMMLQRLKLSEPRGETFGSKVVDANDRLRDHLAPYFDDDLYGMASFLYWLMKEEDGRDIAGPSNDDPGTGEPDLAGLADRLLIGEAFLTDIVKLLEDKGQVILYGPPGTGKTHLAQELAQELAPEESRWTLVQFHPSTSYEDFFEGYRPAGTGDDGGIRYELTPGPLARMAERARQAPEQRHIMVIDEINRGNLPRVLGELLFLLEYRNQRAQTLYRPDEPFSLPKNLWFIGTMNTADRSIALVDAALRRRFHFVPFFPNRDPITGLLGRWLKREEQPAWVGRLVNAVNDGLRRDLEGDHLLLGPSHFMKDYGSTPDLQRERLRRIWEYNIEPFIEDQFFGDSERIENYRFDAVFAHHGPGNGQTETGDSDTDASPADSANSAEQEVAAEKAEESSG